MQWFLTERRCVYIGQKEDFFFYDKCGETLEQVA